MEAEIKKAIQEVLTDHGFDDVKFSLEHPTEFMHGDYASNVALVCAKRANKNPVELAEQFAEELKRKIPKVTKIEIAAPGFINFFLDRAFFAEKISEIITQGNDWGRNNSLEEEEILFEYTSPNLFKPLHIGNLVGNIIGESITRLFEFGGAIVRRLNYPSDIGLTVAKAVWGLKQMNGNPNDINQIGEAYRKGNDAYENNEEGKEEIEIINRSLYANDDPELQELRRIGIQTSRTHLAKLCEQLGTVFDTDIPESAASPVGAELVKKNTGLIFEKSEGAVVYRGEKHGLHTRVYINSQGLPTYEAKDLGNFALKQEKYPNWTRSYVVTGSEQRDYFKVLIESLKEVFPKTKDKYFGHIPTGFLTLTTGKMSSRKGNVLTGEDVLNEVAMAAQERAKESRAPDINELADILSVSAIKYQILRQAIGTDIVFDKDRALSLEGDSGPYLEYTHARIYSIINKAQVAEIDIDTENPPDEVYDIERWLYQFPEVILKSQEEHAPHHLVTYLTNVASAFNSFYGQERIVDTTDVSAPYKLALAAAVKQTLENGMKLLGMKVVDRM